MQRLHAQYRTLDPVRAAQDELGRRIDRRGLSAASQVPLPISKTAAFAHTLGMSIEVGEPRAVRTDAERENTRPGSACPRSLIHIW